jgi:hypothetical protein
MSALLIGLPRFVVTLSNRSVLRRHRRHLEWIYLRLGAGAAQAETEAELEVQVLKVCLEEVRRSRPFLIALIGDLRPGAAARPRQGRSGRSRDRRGHRRPQRH